jgi:hypothetical protein
VGLAHLVLATTAVAAVLTSGLGVGSEMPAFDPRHVRGPDNGSHAGSALGILPGAQP